VRLLLFAHGAAGAVGARPSLRPLLYERDNEMHNPGEIEPRERERSCSEPSLSPPSYPGESAWRVFALDVPGIHGLLPRPLQDVDGGDKPGHDEWGLAPVPTPAQPAACGHNSGGGFPFGNLALTEIIVWLGAQSRVGKPSF
jgi:hypothetical protein